MIPPLEDVKAQAMCATIALLLIRKGIITNKEYKDLVKEIGTTMGVELEFREPLQ